MAEETKKRIPCKPFLKWAGGKSQLLPELAKRAPASYVRYFEPFLGSGALFLHLQPAEAYLSDINDELINCWQVLQSDCEALIEDLKQHVYEEDYFYSLRNVDRTEDFTGWAAIQRASRLLYLNKTCYNGLYRVNQKGQFNTPFGRYTNPTICNEKNLLACSAALQGRQISVQSFTALRKKVAKGDFVYFDPPYAPLSSTSNFTGYSQGGFDQSMQQELRDLCRELDRAEVKFMVSNSASPLIEELYQSFRLDYVEAARAINSKAAKRGKIKEVIITNY